ncbi:MAG: hypothetical protein IPK98_16755 [Chloracidobacterium sp.]|nr:hypothetical protein [Chloracidobacterium sp.]
MLGAKAAFSNALVIEPAAKVAGGSGFSFRRANAGRYPTKVERAVREYRRIAAGECLGYNIYRSTSGERTGGLNKVPVSGKEFSDELFEFSKDYFYFVRAVSPGMQAEPVEAANLTF